MTPIVTPNKSNLIRKTLILFLLVFVMQALFIGTIVVMLVQTKAEVTKQQEARRSLSSIGRTLRSLQDVVRIAGKRDIADRGGSMDEYNDMVIKLHKNLAQLKTTLAGNERYNRSMEIIETNSQKVTDIYSHSNEPTNTPPISNQGTNQYLELVNTGWFRIYQASDEVTTLLEEIQNDFRLVESDAQEHLQFQSGLLFNVSLLLGLVATVVAAFFLYHIFISGLVKRLAQIVKDLSDIRAGKPLPDLTADIEPGDEIGQLAAELREMEKTLRNIRSKEKTLLENSASCICSIDEDGLFVSVSPASNILWGIDPQELIGKSLTEIIESDDADSTSKTLNKLFQDRLPVTFENKLRHRNGNLVELAWKANLAEGNSFAVCVAQDVTARNLTLRNIRESEEEVRGMVNSMPVAVVTCDETSTISSVNPATQTMLDYAPQELLGRKLGLLLTGSITPLSADQLNEIMTAAEKHPIEMRISKSDGNRLPVEFSTREYALHDKNVFLATFKDVSARFQIESVKQEFVAMISHDLRSPLTAIHGTLEFMTMDTRSTNTPADMEDMGTIQTTQKIVYSLVNVLNDFLDLEKFEAGFVALEPQKILTGNLIESVKKAILDKGYSGDMIIDQGEEDCLDTELFIDHDRIVYALSTVFNIAILGSKNPNQLRIKIERTKNDIEFSVSDCLMLKEVRQAFFSPYVFLSDARLQGKVSSGLSPSLSRAIVNAHRGTLRVDQTGDAYQISITLRR